MDKVASELQERGLGHLAMQVDMVSNALDSVTPRDGILKAYVQALLPLVESSDRSLVAPWKVLTDPKGIKNTLDLEHATTPDGEAAYFSKAGVVTIYALPAATVIKERLNNLSKHGTTVNKDIILKEITRYLESSLAHEWKHVEDHQAGVPGIAGADWCDPTEIDALVAQTVKELQSGTEDYAMPYRLDMIFNKIETSSKERTQKEIDALVSLAEKLKAHKAFTTPIAAGFHRLGDTIKRKFPKLNYSSWVKTQIS